MKSDRALPPFCLPKRGNDFLLLHGDALLIQRRLDGVHNAPYHGLLDHHQFHAQGLVRHQLPIVVLVDAVRLEDGCAVRIGQSGVAHHLCRFQGRNFLPPCVFVVEAAIQRIFLHAGFLLVLVRLCGLL